MKKVKTIKKRGVAEYIAKSPKEVQSKLKEVRAAIRPEVPDAMETVSYFGMPGYCCKEISQYNGMFLWFSYKKPFIRLHVLPSVISKYKDKLKDFSKTKALVSFPSNMPVPKALIKTLAKASLKAMKSSES